MKEQMLRNLLDLDLKDLVLSKSKKDFWDKLGACFKIPAFLKIPFKNWGPI